MASEKQLERFMHETQRAMFLFQMIEEALKTSIAYANEGIRLSLPAGIAFNMPESEYENAPLERLLTCFGRVTTNAALLKQLNQLRYLRNYCAHKAFALAFLSEVSSTVDFASEFAKVQGANEAAEAAFEAMKVEMNALGEVRNAALRTRTGG